MVRKYLPYLKKYKWYAVGAPLFMIAEVLVDVFIPAIMENLVNVGISSRNVEYVVQKGLLMMAVAVFGMLAGTLSAFFGSKAGYGGAAELRRAAYRSVQGYSFSNLDAISVPSLITRLTTDADTVGMVTMMSLRMAFRSPFMLIFSLYFAFRINTELAMTFLFVLPVGAVLIYLIFRKAMPYFNIQRQRIDDMNAVVQEQLSGIRIIKAFNRQELGEKSFSKKNEAFRETALKSIRIISHMNPLMTVMIYACMILVLWFGGIRIFNGTLEAGTIIALLSYVMQILISLMMASMYLINLVYGLASLRRMMEVVDTKSEITEKENALTELEDGSIRFENVSFKYEGYRDNILDNISLTIPSGQHVGIVGSTGSSKSTLVQMIPRLYDVNEGAVYVGNHNVKEYSIHALRQQIGFVLQKNSLFSGTIRSNMQWGNANATDEEIIRALKQAQAWEFVSRYDDPLGYGVEQGGSNFSGGQKQRLTIARALLGKHKILILDDSTSAVDMTTDALIRKMFETDLSGVTTVLIAQRIESVKDCDQIFVMERGKIESFGTHDYLLQNSKIYREIYESQAGGLGE
ncbi:MAG: ABC transporter ATP-binding protein [Peptoniphilaceae bacterium]|nr:ABC transporter ATP-binding protein [Peptoniphilaceae bacterium]MDY3075795.1 ABC transporter ATP-binding protein [Peptoniphilaceae bacterium]